MEAEKPKETNASPENDEEDEPIVKELKQLDDEYLKIEREFEAEERALREKFKERLRPLLEERTEVLGKPEKEEDAATSGTPALKSFWFSALRNHPAIEDMIQEHDEAVLEYLKDIRWSPVTEDDKESFTLEFTFISNPFFDEILIQKRYFLTSQNPYNGEQDVKEIKSSSISWKSGKDVTVELKKKKAKGLKNKGNKKEVMEPRHSFFRDFFVTLKQGEAIPEEHSLLLDGMEDASGPSASAVSEYVMQRDAQMGLAIKENIIPYAVRWYTGEAAPDDDDDETEDDECDDDDDDDDDEEEEQKPVGKAKSKAKPVNQAVESGSGGQGKEECKQQ